MNAAAEAILVLQTLAERGFRVRVKGDQLRAIGDGRPPTPMLSDLRRLKQAVLVLAAQGLTWRTTRAAVLPARTPWPD